MQSVIGGKHDSWKSGLQFNIASINADHLFSFLSQSGFDRHDGNFIVPDSYFFGLYIYLISLKNIPFSGSLLENLLLSTS